MPVPSTYHPKDLTMADIHKFHFLQSQVLFYQILHESNARNEANDLANHLSEIVGKESWNRTEDLIADLLEGLRADENYDRVGIHDDVYRHAGAYVTHDNVANRLQRLLERLGGRFWEEYTEAVRVADEENGERSEVMPRFRPLSRETALAYRTLERECSDCQDGRRAEPVRKSGDRRKSGRFRGFLIRRLLGLGGR
ncbi:unnamed protein product [Zymoseptoria tritici ST99CH_3D1]|nr:unnamed protein product [Zymoseptoria tritici ST99CH_3D1]